MTAPGISSTGLRSRKYREYFWYFALLAEQAERTLPPLDVVVARHDQYGRVGRNRLKKACAAWNSPCRARWDRSPADNDGIRPERREERLEGLDLRQIGVAAEVEVREVRDDDPLGAHLTTRSGAGTSPRLRRGPGTFTRKRVRTVESFSAGTELFTTDHSPARSSITSTVVALSVALRTVTR